MTATQYVSEARRAAPWLLANRWLVMGKALAVVSCSGAPMVVRTDDPPALTNALMWAEFPADKSEEALARGLVASALRVTWHGNDLAEPESGYVWTLGATKGALRAEHYDSAVSAALDALLVTPEALP